MIDNTLQKLVDFKLQGVSPSLDDNSDYYENYCDIPFPEKGALKKIKIKLNEFLNFKTSQKEIISAILNSNVFKKEHEKWKMTFAKQISYSMMSDIIENIEWIKNDLKSEDKVKKEEVIRKIAIEKLKNAKLSKEEKKAIGILSA